MKFDRKDFSKTFNGRVTILVNSCDAYADVLKLFYAAINEFWPNRTYPIVVNTESSALLSYSDKEKKSQSWGARLIDILNKIDTPYIIMLFDDFILESAVNQNKIEAALNVLDEDNQSSVFYLNAACVSDHEDMPFSDYRLLKDNVDYRLNSVPSVWKKEDLLKFTKSMDNPWSWEVFGSYRTFNKRKNFYSSSSQSKNIYNYNYSKGGAIYRGKWVREVVCEKVSKYRLDIDLSVRGFVNLNEELKRPLSWKINFILLGFKSIGFKMTLYMMRALKTKMRRALR